jgi:uncharacterized protein YfcZ (UPF0381/DUF406 family)
MSLLAWRRHPKLWVPAAVFFFVNLGFLAAYRLVLAEEAELGRGLLERRESELARMEDVRKELELVQAEARATEEGLQVFYAERLATEERMLTTVIAKVKQLASQAGLEPAAIRYDKEDIKRQNLIQRALTFRVEGTYDQLRQLINFLELSRQAGHRSEDFHHVCGTVAGPGTW